MGITQKLIIPLNDVTKITKAKSLGLLKAIKIYQQGKKSSYKFQSFTDCDKTFKIIFKLWSNVSPNAQEDAVHTEEEVTEDDAGNNSMISDLNKPSTGAFKRSQTNDKDILNKSLLNASFSKQGGPAVAGGPAEIPVNKD